MGSEYIDEKRRRQQALRNVRNKQRQSDSAIERFERRVFALQRRKTILTADDAKNLATVYQAYVQSNRDLERAMTDFYLLLTA